jgi:hypothetical protein
MRQEVAKAGGKFNIENLWVWVSPGGRNKGITHGTQRGFSISGEELAILTAAGPEFEQYAIPGAGASDEKPHGLDTVGLTIGEIMRVGVSSGHVAGLFEDTVTTRTPAGKLKWGSQQAMGPDFVSSIVAGTVYDLPA